MINKSFVLFLSLFLSLMCLSCEALRLVNSTGSTLFFKIKPSKAAPEVCREGKLPAGDWIEWHGAGPCQTERVFVSVNPTLHFPMFADEKDGVLSSACALTVLDPACEVCKVRLIPIPACA